MPRKDLSVMKIVTIALVAVLFLSCFAGMFRFVGGDSNIVSTQTAGSASVIASLENSIEENGGWNSSLQTIYDGIALGQTTVHQLQSAVDAINVASTSAAEEVFYWYYVLGKFGVSINATTIEAALNEVTMLPNVGGLPYDYSNSGVASFLLYNRYDLYAYLWASQLNYETAKWNLTVAYTVFKNSVNACGKPILCVGSNQAGWGIEYGPRYYDESAETIDMYLTFWLLGIPDGLTQAQYWWNWVNANLWDTTDNAGGSFYKYAYDWTAFECEAGSFDQIVWKLYSYDQTISNVTNLFTDMETRALSQSWNSPQWANYVVVHASGVNGSGGNPQERLENTIVSWASMLGFYANMTSTMQSQVQALLDGSAGSAPAWNLTLQSELYDASNGMFRIHSDASDSVEATADGAALVMLLSTVPLNGSLAVPLEECTYQDINNIIDGGVSNINLTARTVTISVSKPGTFLSMFGTNIFEYDLKCTGVWQLTFASDWNSLTAETLVSSLPTSRSYIGTIKDTNYTTISASSDSFSTIAPSGRVNVSCGDNQTFTYSANAGCTVTQVLVDGSPVPITGSYTFTDVKAPQTISVYSSPSPTPTPTLTPTPTPITPLMPLIPPILSANPTPTESPTPSPTPTITPTTSTAPINNIPEFPSIIILLIIGLAASVTMTFILRKVKAEANEKHSNQMQDERKQHQ